MKLCSLLCCCTIILTPPLLAENKKYTLEELNALAVQEEWQEFLSHAKDVSPKNRKKTWNENLERAAIGVLTDASKKSPIEAFSWANHLADQFKTLKKSKPYMKHRGEIGIKALKDCFSNRYAAQSCFKAMTDFVAGDANNVQLNYTAGKLARLNMNSVTAVPFFAAAVKNAGAQKGQEICNDNDIEIAVIAGLNLPSSYDNVAPSKVLLKRCFDALKKPVFEEFLKGGSYNAQNTCDIWKKNNMLSPFQKAHCKDRGDK